MIGRLAFLQRLTAVLVKEFLQMRRDRLTFAMMVGIPIFQLVMFGFAINTDPKHLPSAVLMGDNGPEARAVLSALEATDYFRITAFPDSESEARWLTDRGDVLFVFTIPTDFSRDLQRGARPQILVEADASDPVATGNAISSLDKMARGTLPRDLLGSAARPAPSAVEFVVHRRFNAEGESQYNIVPGLMGTILTLTLVIMTALAMTRERERGTMESLLSMPVRPIEVMVGKIVPYIVVGYVQVLIILLFARFVFDVPMVGSLVLLSAALIVFIALNLAIGFTFSTLARTQLQAMQMSMFFFLPSILLSGFMFPFRGMPEWAQWLGEILPMTHFLRIVRGVLLKGNGPAEIAWEVGVLTTLLVLVSALALARYQQTLD